MSSKIYLPETFSASTGKKLKSDAILPVGLGALLLLDGNHSIGGLGPGVPATNTPLPNVAYDDAKALIPSGDVATLGASFFHSAGFGGMGKERTAKGGLHIAARQDTLTANNGAFINMGSAISAYLAANPNNDYYFGLWERVTRAGQIVLNPALPSLSIITTTGSATGNFLVILDQTGARGITHSPVAGYSNGNRQSGAAPNTVGNSLRNVGTLQAIGAISGVKPVLIPWGAVGDWGGFLAANPSAATSRVFYRCYIEDLTVSGRSYAEVDAIDYALWQKEFAVGGRYYNDTFTDPAVLAGG